MGHADKKSLLGDLDEAFARLLSEVDSLPDLKPSLDDWGAFEVLAHIIGWHSSAAERLRKIAAGLEVAPPGDVDELNQRFVSERRGLSRDAILTQLRDSFEEMRAAAEQVPDSGYWRGEAGAEDSLAYFILNENGPEHYDEHMADLRTTPA